MGEWGSALIFGLALVAFVLGIASIITALITPKQDDVLQKQVEYGFFGVAGLVLGLVFLYAMG